MADLTIFKRTFNYGGADVYPGQVQPKQHLLHDQKLIDRDYMGDYDGKADKLVHCDDCSRDFANDAYYNAHLRTHEQPYSQVGSTLKVTKLEDLYPMNGNEPGLKIGPGTQVEAL